VTEGTKGAVEGTTGAVGISGVDAGIVADGGITAGPAGVDKMVAGAAVSGAVGLMSGVVTAEVTGAVAVVTVEVAE
jgi:hypothetical protein